MNRRFGIELEIAGITKNQALEAMRAVGIRVETENMERNEVSAAIAENCLARELRWILKSNARAARR